MQVLVLYKFRCLAEGLSLCSAAVQVEACMEWSCSLLGESVDVKLYGDVVAEDIESLLGKYS